MTGRMGGNSKLVTERNAEQSNKSTQTNFYSAVYNSFDLPLECEGLFLFISMFVCLFVAL